jgi:hypothetical protein
MTKKEALSLLNSTTLEDALENYELLIFEQKNKLLLKIPPIKILNAINARIKKYGEALKILHIDNADDFIEKKLKRSIKSSSHILNHLKNYQENISAIKLNIANLTDSEKLSNQISLLINSQAQLFLYLSSLSDLSINAVDSENLKLSEEIDVFKLQQEIIKNELDTTDINDYISSRKESYLYKSIILAKKQIEYNGLR